MPEIKNLKKTADRILKAISNKEKIILYGDADLDGVASVMILKETIKSLANTIYNRQRVRNRRARSHISSERTDYIQRGGLLFVYFPNREKQGYGINFSALKDLKKYPPALFIALDCGISNFKEAESVKKLGFKLIIIDHHEILNNKLPKALIIVDPKQKGDRYSFKELATVGIAFKLAELISKEGFEEEARKKFLQIVALATIADMMVKEKDNKIFIDEGLKYIEKDPILGLKVLLESENIKKINNFNQKIYAIISLLNVRDVVNNLPVGFRLLTIDSFAKAKKIVRTLLKKNEKRKSKIQKTIKDANKKILKEGEGPIIFIGDSSWDLISLGSVASLLARNYNKPSFVYKEQREKIQGTSRTPKGFNLVRAMEKCAHYLETYGGHPMAAGFRLKNNNLNKFKACLANYFLGIRH